MHEKIIKGVSISYPEFRVFIYYNSEIYKKINRS